jgi:hypothetical protein
MIDSPTPFLAAAAAALLLAAGATANAADPTGCQFLESENGVDHGYKPKSEADCNKINAETGAERLAKAKTVELKPGKYIFRVTNKNVPYQLGFWLRESDYQPGNPLHKLSKISVSGGGLTLGKTQDYEVDLKPGEYLYSCPLNPTPDYKLVVKG